MASRWLLAFVAGLLLVSGCSSSPYVSGYTYYPQPATVEVLRRGSNLPPPLSVLVSILGIHRGDPKHSIPYSVVVRMRFENIGQSRVSFDPRTLELVTGTLRSFPPPIVEPPQPVELAPGQRRELTAYFPFPPNTKASQMNLKNLRLRWEVKIDAYTVPQTALFERVERDEYYPETDLNY